LFTAVIFHFCGKKGGVKNDGENAPQCRRQVYASWTNHPRELKRRILVLTSKSTYLLYGGGGGGLKKRFIKEIGAMASYRGKSRPLAIRGKGEKRSQNYIF